MEGPLVSDTTEILSGAPTASEDAPAAVAATASTSKSRSRGGAGLSSMLMPELQRIAQTLAIPGAGRMRKSQLIEAIEARQGGGPRQQTSVADARAGGSGGVVPPGQQGSDQRAASAGAGATRPQKQDAMQPDTHSRSGIGDSAQPGLGDGGRGGIGADGVGGATGPAQQQLSFYEEADSAAGREGAAPAAATAETGQGDTQRGDRRRRNGQPSRGRDQAPREQSGRDGASRDSAGRDQGARDQGARDQGGREQNRDHGNRDQGSRDSRDQGGDRRDQGGDRREPVAAGRGPGGDQFRDDDGDGGRRRSRDRFRNRNRRRDRQSDPEPVIAEDDVLIPIAGILDVLETQGYAFVRTTGYLPGPNDVYVSLSQVRKNGLRKGDVIEGAVRQPREGERREKFNALVRLDKVNGLDPEQSSSRPEFSKLVPLYPQERLRLETDPGNMITRIIDLICPIGKGQRGLIVSPPKAGKTMVLAAIAAPSRPAIPRCT